MLAAAAEPGCDCNERFRLLAPVRPRLVDGVSFYLRLPFAVARELRAFRPDAVLVQGVHEAALVLIARRFARSRAKVILDVQGDWHATTRLYGSRARRLLNPLNDRLAPPVVRRVDAVRTVSRQTTALVRSLGVDTAAVFPAYVDATAFLERPPAALPEQPAALFVGVLERYKGFDTLVAAWRLAAPRVPQARLQLVGTGSLQPLAAALVDELPGQTAWSPRLAAADVAAAMDASTLLCLPSRSEGLPRVAIEAMCRGRAVIGGRDAGGIPDIVEPGVNGLLIDPDDAGDLADALVLGLSDRDLAARLGTAARATGERWSVTPTEYARKIGQLVHHALRETR